MTLHKVEMGSHNSIILYSLLKKKYKDKKIYKCINICAYTYISTEHNMEEDQDIHISSKISSVI